MQSLQPPFGRLDGFDLVDLEIFIAVADARSMTPQALADYLAKYAN